MLRNKKGMTLIEVTVTMLITVLIMAALFSFFIGAQRGSAQVRKVAYSGQAVEMALTQLRQELAGSLWLGASADGNLRYDSARDELRWTIQLEDRVLRRVLVYEDTEGNLVETIMILARNIDEFTFVLPGLNEEILVVAVISGNFRLQDEIFLRNSSLGVWFGGNVGGEEDEEYPHWRPNIRYEAGERVFYEDSNWQAKEAVSGGNDRPGAVSDRWQNISN